MQRITVTELSKRVRSEADAYLLLEELRWAEGVECPHCASTEAKYLAPANGVSRKTRTGAMSERRVWKCCGCRKQFSVLTGTIMHGTKVSIRSWLFIIFEMAASKNGVAAREIERKYGVAARTAWFVMHRIREAMKDDGLTMFRGVVVADETYIGGKFGNMHMGKRPARTAGRDGAAYGKTAVLTLIEKDSGQARSRIMPRVTATTLRKAIAEQADLPSTTLYTDRHKGYVEVGREVAAHETVDHNADQYVRYENGAVITSNACESFFSQLKRSLDGTHHHVSTEHLHRYLAEFDFRHTTRKSTDTERMLTMLGRFAGRRLTYSGLTA